MRSAAANGADPAVEFEALVLRQVLAASRAFSASDAAGAHVESGLFIDALADAVARAGGIGIAKTIRDGMPPDAPLQAAALTSGFGARMDPMTGRPAIHQGLDIGAAKGAPILAVADGVVRQAGPRGGYGLAIEIDHGGGVTSLYGHASEALVRTGDRVRRGEPVARVGSTGRATGPHLHFEMRVANRPIDPTRALNAYSTRAETGGVGSGIAKEPRP